MDEVGELEGLGPAMLALNERRRLFVLIIDQFPKITLGEAAERAGFGGPPGGDPAKRDHVLRQTGYRLMHDEKIIAALHETASKNLRSGALLAVKALIRLVENEKHKDHARAIEMMLSRTGFVERTAHDVNVRGEITVNHTEEAIEQLRVLKGLGLPQPKLIELFGFSGLGRYERLLAEADSRQAKVIEAQPGERIHD